MRIAISAAACVARSPCNHRAGAVCVVMKKPPRHGIKPVVDAEAHVVRQAVRMRDPPARVSEQRFAEVEGEFVHCRDDAVALDVLDVVRPDA